DQIRVIRQPPGTIEKKVILVDLDAVNKRLQEDIVLVAGDIVEVPVSGGKQFLRSLLGSVVPAVAQLPMRAIPY
ncbi:MAG: MoaD/ThiS family protein, partial [Pyrinomonadaceae bacterium]|nr:MoaD/ThiS family protein [Pyrinomonadaceae bacterium]